MILEKYIGYPETMRFDIVDNQIMVIMSRENIKRYPLGGFFEFRFEPVYNIILKTEKINIVTVDIVITKHNFTEA